MFVSNQHRYLVSGRGLCVCVCVCVFHVMLHICITNQRTPLLRYKSIKPDQLSPFRKEGERWSGLID